MTVPVLDASALLALLLDEPGAGKVRAALVGAIMTTVNLGEVVGHFARNGAAEADIRAVLDPLPIERADFDDELAYDVGLLLLATKPFGLSFGDRACLALARRHRAHAGAEHPQGQAGATGEGKGTLTPVSKEKVL